MEMMSTEIKDLMTSLSKAQGVMEGASKDVDNHYFKSKYADLANVWEACRQPLAENGLSIIQVMQIIENKTCLVTILGHSTGQWIKSITPMPIEKPDPQTLGKCITYCRRYALAAMVGIYQEDDDAESIMGRGEKKPQLHSSKEDDQAKEPEKAKVTVLTDQQVATIKKMIEGHPDVIKEVLSSTGQKLIKDIPYGKYQEVMKLIDEMMKKRGAA